MNNLKKEDAAHEGATQIYVYNNMGENSITVRHKSKEERERETER